MTITILIRSNECINASQNNLSCQKYLIINNNIDCIIIAKNTFIKLLLNEILYMIYIIVAIVIINIIVLGANISSPVAYYKIISVIAFVAIHAWLLLNPKLFI